MAIRPIAAALLSAALLASSACSSSAPTDGPASCDGSKCDEAAPALGVCVAIRGNGQWIFAHFGALARVIEDHGFISAAAGGSSGSITIFMLESIQQNPLVKDCGDETCRRERAALMFRSVDAYVQEIAQTQEVRALTVLFPLAAKVKAEGLAALQGQEALDALNTVLRSDELKSLVNQELLDVLATSPARIELAQEIIAALADSANFSVTSPRILLRPGVIDFGSMATLLGRIGDFYAGYGATAENKAAMEEFLSACGSAGAGKLWPQIAEIEYGDTNCASLFGAAFASYRHQYLADIGDSSRPHRIDENVGAYMPALVSTSVLTGDNVTAWRTARAAYEAGEMDIPWSMDFDQVKFGYFGRAADLAKVERDDEKFGDAKTAKFMPLGETSWQTALSLSPAEPGLASAQPIPGRTDILSAGGWSDLAPTLVLRNLGCETIVYVTREGEESPFCTGVAELVGMTTEIDSIYSLAAPPEGQSPSGFRLSVEQTDIPWCTDWNDVTTEKYPNFIEFMRALYESGHNGDKSDGGPGCTVE